VPGVTPGQVSKPARHSACGPDRARIPAAALIRRTFVWRFRRSGPPIEGITVDEYAAVLGTADARSRQRQLLLEEATGDAPLGHLAIAAPFCGYANRIQAASQETRESFSQAVSAGYTTLSGSEYWRGSSNAINGA